MHSRTSLLLLMLMLLALVAACRPADPGADATATVAPPETPIPATETAPAEPDPTATVEPDATATIEPTPTLEQAEPGPDLEALRQQIASQHAVDLDSVSVVSSELLPADDLCLGVFDGGNCYRVGLLVDGNPVVYHVNDAGSFTMVVESVPAQPGQIVITFGRENCQVGALRQEAPPVGIGACASEFLAHDFGGDAAATEAELQELLSTYAPFTATTSAGFLSFGGTGSTVADAQQQEDIAAWVRAVLSDAVAQGPSDDAFCSRLARPVLVTQSQGQFAIVDPLTGDQCDLTLPTEWRGALQAAGGFLYFQDVEGNEALIREMSPDGTLRPLEATRIDMSEESLLGFVVSDDGRTVAWSTAALNGQPGMTSSLYVADTSADTAQPIVEDLARDDGRGLIPIRFDETGQILVYGLQPFGIGGAWPSFVGRYDILYTVPASGGEGQLRFDCPALGLFLCVGDFRLQDGELEAIAYVNGQTIEVVDGDGAPISSIDMDAEYVAYPTFSPEGELVFYTATIGEGEGGFPFAEPGAYYRLSPAYDGEPVLIAEQDGLLTPYMWFDAQHLIVGVADAEGNWGTGLLSLDGTITRLEPWPGTQAIAVIRQ